MAPEPISMQPERACFLGRVGHTGVMGDLMQQGGGGSRKSVSAEELGDIGSSNAALGHNRTFAVQKLSASTSEPSTLTCLVLS
jgi:hypothetical protein